MCFLFGQELDWAFCASMWLLGEKQRIQIFFLLDSFPVAVLMRKLNPGFHVRFNYAIKRFFFNKLNGLRNSLTDGKNATQQCFYLDWRVETEA